MTVNRILLYFIKKNHCPATGISISRSGDRYNAVRKKKKKKALITIIKIYLEVFSPSRLNIMEAFYNVRISVSGI